MGIKKLPHYKTCFGCGVKNPKGLKLERFWNQETGEVFTEFILEEWYNGFEYIAHGGILAVIVDEVLWWCVFMNTRKITVTYKLNLTFKKPVEVGKKYKAIATVLETKARTITGKAVINDEEGNEALEAEGLFVVTKEQDETLIRELLGVQ